MLSGGARTEVGGKVWGNAIIQDVHATGRCLQRGLYFVRSIVQVSYKGFYKTVEYWNRIKGFCLLSYNARSISVYTVVWSATSDQDNAGVQSTPGMTRRMTQS